MIRVYARVEQVLFVAVCGVLLVGCGGDGSTNPNLNDGGGTVDLGPLGDGSVLDQSAVDQGLTSDGSVIEMDLGADVDLGTAPVDMGTAPTGTCSGSVSFDCTRVSPLDCTNFLAAGCSQGAAFCADDPSGSATAPAECSTISGQTSCAASGAFCSWTGSTCVPSDACTPLSAGQCAGGVSVPVGTGNVQVSCFTVRPCVGSGTFNCGTLTSMSGCTSGGCTWTPN